MFENLRLRLARRLLPWNHCIGKKRGSDGTLYSWRYPSGDPSEPGTLSLMFGDGEPVKFVREDVRLPKMSAAPPPLSGAIPPQSKDKAVAEAIEAFRMKANRVHVPRPPPELPDV